MLMLFNLAILHPV